MPTIPAARMRESSSSAGASSGLPTGAKMCIRDSCFPIENRGNAFGKIWHGSKGFGKRVFVGAHFNQQRGRADVLVIAIALYHHIAAQARMPRG